MGCWLDVRLASQRIYTQSDIFLLLDKAFPAGGGGGGGGGPMCVLPSVLCLPSLPATGPMWCGKSDWTFCFHPAFPDLSDDLLKPELDSLQLRTQPRPPPLEFWQGFRKCVVTR